MDIITEAARSLLAEGKQDQTSIDLLMNIDAESFTDVILKTDDALSFKTIINNCSLNVKACVIGYLAELAKSEENRNVLSKNGIVHLLLNEIEVDNHDIILQCFRAIGNICIENDDGRRAVLNSGCISKLLDKFKQMANLPDEELGNLPRMAYGCVNNISDENESLQLELINQGAIPVFFNGLKSFVSKNSEMAELVMEVLSGLAVCDIGKQQFIELQIIEESISLLQTCSDKIAIVILSSLCQLIEDDELCDILCSERCLLALISAGKSRNSYCDKDGNDEVLKKIFDTLVLLTSNESFEADCSDKNLLNSFLEMLKSNNKHVQISAALALGNYARNDIVCADLVKEDVHMALINFLKTVVDMEDTSEQIQAVLSALKNISIPVSNKAVLIDTDLPTLAIKVVKIPVAALQFKALAILRLLVQGQPGLAVQLCKDNVLLQSIVDCSQREVILGLCAEARRLLAALVKNCQSSDALNSLLANNAMPELVSLLTSDHAIMQNEGLVAIVTLLSCGKDATAVLIETDGIDQATKLFQQSLNKSHLVFNLISLFTAICQDEKGKNILRDKIMKEVEEMTNGPNEMVQNRCVDLLKLLRS